MVRGAVLGLALAGLLSLPGPAGAQEYHVAVEEARSVVFRSSIPLNEFEGVTDRVDGYVLLDGRGLRESGPLEGAELYFEVDLASLDTGIALRDRHMREDYLHVDDHPFATFFGSVKALRPRGAGGFTVVSAGEFGVHGVTRERELQCIAEPTGAFVDVECAFTVSLEDHDIDIPRLMFMKLASEVELEISFRLTQVSGADGGV